MIKKTALFVSALVALPLLAAAQDVNTVKAIRAVDDIVEIELESSKPFEIRNDLIVLRIGDREFSLSKTPKDGSLNRLIFMVPAKDFAALPDGQAMRVHFRSDNVGGDLSAAGGRSRGRSRWDFGKLNKSLLQR
jgi:hypothetical protein